MDMDSVIAVNDSTPLHSGSSETCQAIPNRSQKNLGSEPDLKIYSVGSWVGTRARRCELHRAHVIVIELVGQVSPPSGDYIQVLYMTIHMELFHHTLHNS